ncbi:hypothetical protein [Bradyrhizobium hipponense]|uniref:hypothetical protein n=1 Tax=Bradyrhizobium hipponense TaxID=2605638 RepID=UPI0016532300|nr:hypothetical protein [Bradyrhizobium hipponense]
MSGDGVQAAVDRLKSTGSTAQTHLSRIFDKTGTRKQAELVRVPMQTARGARSSTQHHLTPVPLHRWHFTTLSPFLSKPLPSQFLHFCFFFMFGPFSLTMKFSCR